MRKRISKRRWKARCRMFSLIPREAIENHSLAKWFKFKIVSAHGEVYQIES